MSILLKPIEAQRTKLAQFEQALVEAELEYTKPSSLVVAYAASCKVARIDRNVSIAKITLRNLIALSDGLDASATLDDTYNSLRPMTVLEHTVWHDMIHRQGYAKLLD